MLFLTIFAAAITAAATSRMGEIIAHAASAFVASLEFAMKNWLYGEEYPWYYPRCLFTTPPAPYTLKWFFYAATGEPLYRCAFSPTWMSVFINCVFLFMCTCPLVFTLWKAMVHWTDPIGNFYTTWLLEMFTVESIQPPDPAPRRVTFDHSVDVYKYVPTTHTHADSAATRNNGSAFLCFVAKQMGLTPYLVQMSRSDQRRGREGCRSTYWAKDMYTAPREFAPPQNAALVYMDVDMYMDMPRMLCLYPTVQLISTFQPTSVAESTEDFSFTFDAESVVSYTVSGGASFQHKVWNYSGDVLYPAVFDWQQFKFCSVAYHVQRRQSDTHHQLICLIPFRVYKSIMPVHRLLPPQPLERLQIAVDEDFLRLEIVTENGTNVSTGLTNRWVSATIPAALDDTLAVAASLARDDLSMATTLQTAKTATGTSLPTEAAHVLLAYHRVHKSGIKKTSKTYPVQPSVTKFQFDLAEADTEAEACMKSYMKPLCKPSAAPAKSRANEQRSVDGRVNEIKTPLLKPSTTQLQRLEFFAEYIVPEEQAGTGVPVDEAEVFRRQPRPSQQKILEVAAASPEEKSEETLATMMKAEAYGKVTDPRNITMIPGKNKLVYSRYIYDFVDKIMAFKPWYAFCRTPKEIALKVAEICKRARFHVNCGDLSRFDGRMSNICRLVERYCMTRYFGPDPTLLEMMDTQLEQKARTRHGVKYNTGQSRLSGSPETAAFNTLVNAFMVFSAFCEMGYTMQEAKQLLDELALLGGDDSLVADVECEAYVKACKDVGHVLEPEEIPQGEFGVNFLARFYSDQVWYGCPDSMCDLARQLSKLHMTVSMPASVTPSQKLKEKATSYVLTDSETPVIGEYCQQALETLQSVETNDKIFAPLRSWFARFDRSVQWPNSNATRWMEWYLVNRWLPNFDHRRFQLWIQSIKEGRESLFDCPGFERVDLTVPAVKNEVIVNDTVLSPPSPAEPEKTEKPVVQRATTPKGTPRPAGRGNNSRRGRNTPQTTTPAKETRVQPSACRPNPSSSPNSDIEIDPGAWIPMAATAAYVTLRNVLCLQVVFNLFHFARGIWGFCRERAMGRADAGPTLCLCKQCTQTRRRYPNSIWPEPVRAELKMSRFFRESVRGFPDQNNSCPFLPHRNYLLINPFSFVVDPPTETNQMSSNAPAKAVPAPRASSSQQSSRKRPRSNRSQAVAPLAKRRNARVQPNFPTGSSYRADKHMQVAEDEFISNVKSSENFRNHIVLPVNPGQADTFPWLANIAKQFDKYEFKMLEFYYKPTVSGFASAGQRGKVMLSFDFDAADPPPANKQQVEDRYPHADCMPYETCRLRVNPAQMRNQDSKYVRPGILPAGTDIKTYDAGTFTLSTEGGELDATIGELRVRYVVDLFVPVLESDSTSTVNFRVSQFAGSQNLPSGIATTTCDIDDDGAFGIVTTTDPLRLRHAGSSTTLDLPAGNFLISTQHIIENQGSEVTLARLQALWKFGTDVPLEMAVLQNNAAAAKLTLTVPPLLVAIPAPTTFVSQILADTGAPTDPPSLVTLTTVTSV